MDGTANKFPIICLCFNAPFWILLCAQCLLLLSLEFYLMACLNSSDLDINVVVVLAFFYYCRQCKAKYCFWTFFSYSFLNKGSNDGLVNLHSGI